mgnify:CR=1 FL=1
MRLAGHDRHRPAGGKPLRHPGQPLMAEMETVEIAERKDGAAQRMIGIETILDHGGHALRMVR